MTLKEYRQLIIGKPYNSTVNLTTEEATGIVRELNEMNGKAFKEVQAMNATLKKPHDIDRPEEHTVKQLDGSTLFGCIVRVID